MMFRLVVRLSIVAACLAVSFPLAARDMSSVKQAYRWSPSAALAPAEAGRQRAETALASDGKSRVWVSYLDAEYKRSPQGQWLAWPRKVMLWSSSDGGRTFPSSRALTEIGGDEALAADAKGALFASWVDYYRDKANALQQRIVVKRIGDSGTDGEPIQCLPWEDGVRHDQSHVVVGADGTLHMLGTDIGPKSKGRPAVLYAQSSDGGKTCTNQHRMESLGSLPQVGVSGNKVVIAGPDGIMVSADGGKTFGSKKALPIGDKLARVTVSPDGKTVYVVGDNSWNGLWVYASVDGGINWRRTQVVTPGTGKAWRFPAVHVDGKQRVHVVWMDDRDGFGAIHHAFSEDRGETFSAPVRVSDVPFPFPAKAPPPPPGTQDGTWIGDYIGLTSAGEFVVVAWSDQRAGPTQATVFVSVGSAEKPAK